MGSLEPMADGHVVQPRNTRQLNLQQIRQHRSRAGSEPDALETSTPVAVYSHRAPALITTSYHDCMGSSYSSKYASKLLNTS